jgi:carbon-monoxide dehydrogenase large subunit
MSVPFTGRREDGRLLTGQGRYASDWSRPGQLHAHFLRADRAHAEIVSLDLDAARRMPGVVVVFSGADTTKAGSSRRRHW